MGVTRIDIAGHDRAERDDTGIEQTRLDLYAGAMACRAHQIPGRQALGGELHAYALDPAPPGTARTGRPECQPVIWLLDFCFGHRTLRGLCLPSQNLCPSRCAVGPNVTSGEPSGPMIKGLLI